MPAEPVAAACESTRRAHPSVESGRRRACANTLLRAGMARDTPRTAVAWPVPPAAPPSVNVWTGTYPYRRPWLRAPSGRVSVLCGHGRRRRLRSLWRWGPRPQQSGAGGGGVMGYPPGHESRSSGARFPGPPAVSAGGAGDCPHWRPSRGLVLVRSRRPALGCSRELVRHSSSSRRQTPPFQLYRGHILRPSPPLLCRTHPHPLSSRSPCCGPLSWSLSWRR